MSFKKGKIKYIVLIILAIVGYKYITIDIYQDSRARGGWNINELNKRELAKIEKILEINLEGDFDVINVMSCSSCDKARVVLGNVKSYENVLKESLKVDLNKIDVKEEEFIGNKNYKLDRDEIYVKTQIYEGDTSRVVLLKEKDLDTRYLVYEDIYRDKYDLTRVLINFGEYDNSSVHKCERDE
ncbi:MAG: hypothetical protein ACRC6T_03210 [Sarcina sp.]